MSEVAELNLNTDWKKVLDLISKCKFSENYKNYYCFRKERGYLIEDKRNSDIFFFLFKEQKSIKIYFDNENFELIKVYTSLEIDSFIKAKKKDIKDAYFIDDKEIKYCDNINILGIFLDNNKGLGFIEKKPLDKLEFKRELNMNMDYTPSQYSKYFYEYFPNEDISQKNTIIKFEKNIFRKKIFWNVFNLRENKNLKTFKITGPSSIGKSFTLFRFCHTLLNMAYINLKILNNHKDDLHKSYSIIISELQRFAIRRKLVEINTLILNNYNNNNSY